MKNSNDFIEYATSEDNMVITIYNSYKVVSKFDMLNYLHSIYFSIASPSLFDKVTVSSMIKEWQAHNLLYELHICRKRTKDVDLNVEPWYKRIIYSVLACIYNMLFPYIEI